MLNTSELIVILHQVKHHIKFLWCVDVATTEITNTCILDRNGPAAG